MGEETGTARRGDDRIAVVEFAITEADLTGDVRLIAVAGELDFAVVDQLQTALARADRRRDVLIDLGLCEFIDSSAVALFVQVEGERRSNGQRLILAGPSDQVARVLDLTGLSENGLVFGALDVAVAVADGGN